MVLDITYKYLQVSNLTGNKGIIFEDKAGFHLE